MLAELSACKERDKLPFWSYKQSELAQTQLQPKAWFPAPGFQLWNCNKRESQGGMFEGSQEQRGESLKKVGRKAKENPQMKVDHSD